MKTFLVTIPRCVGCHDCQIGCKDEHCDNEWMPYTRQQPETGQFWCKVNQFERGNRPHVKLTYIPVMCQHCKNAPCIKAAKDGAVYRRDDGLVLIDPEKAKGQKQIVDSCPYHAIFWNEELQIPQKCTGCAHLIDGDEPIHEPRCSNNCHTNALVWCEEDELDLEGAEKLHPEYGTEPSVWYKGLPKKFVAGTVYDPSIQEVVIGANCKLVGDAGTFETTTDAFGDFWLEELPDDDWKLTIAKEGKEKVLDVSTAQRDIGLPDIPLD